MFRLFAERGTGWAGQGPISSSSREKLDICPLSKLPARGLPWKVNCLAAAGGVLRPPPLPALALLLFISEGLGAHGRWHLSCWVPKGCFPGQCPPGAKESWPGPAATGEHEEVFGLQVVWEAFVQVCIFHR